MKILICEDHPTTALDLWWLLHEQGHSICGIARTTTACLEKVVQSCPDLVMVDEDVADSLTGASLVATLAMSGLPSVLISGEPHSAAGATTARAVLPKPFSEAALASVMARVDRLLDERETAA